MATSSARDTSCVAAIFFDLDNTLIQTRKADSKTCNKLVGILTEEYGVPDDEAIRATSSFLRTFRRCPDNPEWDLDSWRIHLWSQALQEEFAHLANDVYLQWLELRYHYLAISPEILSLLSSLRKHYLLGLITNGTSRAQWEKVERLDIKCYFDCILVSGDWPWEKPDQKIFQEACQVLDVDPKHCIMVGDKLETDIQGGIEAELGGTVWIPLKSSDSADDMGKVVPDFTIDSVTQLPAVLPANPGPLSPSPRSEYKDSHDHTDCKRISEECSLTHSDIDNIKIS